MSHLLFFLLRKKTISLLQWPQIGNFLLYFLTAFLLGITYGFGLSYLIDNLVEGNTYTVHQCMLVYTVIFGLLFLILDIFPSLKLTVIKFPPFYPISLSKKIAINITFSFLRHFVFFMALIQTILLLASDYIQVIHILSSSVILLGFYGMNRVLKNSLEFLVKNSSILIAFSGVLLCFSLLIYWRYGNTLTGVFSSFLPRLLIGYVYVLSESRKKIKLLYSIGSYKKSIFFQILANKNVKILIGIAFVFKVMMLLPISIVNIMKGKYLFDVKIITFMMASPLILFTYLGYNFFGVNKNIFFTHALRESTVKNLFKLYGRFYLILLTIDTLIYFIFIFLTGLNSLENIVFYFTSSLLLLITAFPFSLKMPIIKDKYMSLDFTKYGNKIISWPAMATAFLILFMTYVIKDLEYFWAYSLLIILLGIFISKLLCLDIESVAQKFYMEMKKN